MATYENEHTTEFLPEDEGVKFNVCSMLGRKKGDPSDMIACVSVQMGEGQESYIVTVEEARNFAYNILSACAYSEYERGIMGYFTDEVQMTYEGIVGLIGDMGAWRRAKYGV